MDRKGPKKNQSILFKECFSNKKLIWNNEKNSACDTTHWGEFKNSWIFLRESMVSKEIVGAILPSSQFLAKEIVSTIPEDVTAPKRRILEIGPGTGVFTEKIISRMNLHDVLDLVEFDEKFCQQLHEKYKHFSNVRVFHQSILDYEVGEDEKYHYVVSGLPLNSFPLSIVRQMFLKFQNLTVDGGMLSYFEYIFLAKIKRFCLGDEAGEIFDEILSLKEDFFFKYGERKKNVLRNMPPARVLHHKLHS